MVAQQGVFGVIPIHQDGDTAAWHDLAEGPLVDLPRDLDRLRVMVEPDN